MYKAEKLMQFTKLLFPLFRLTVGRNVEAREYTINMVIQMTIEETRTDFGIFSDAKMPIPECMDDATYVLPGDGSVESFVLGLGESIGQTAVEAVMRHLGIKQYLSEQQCSIPDVDVQNSGEILLFMT